MRIGLRPLTALFDDLDQDGLSGPDPMAPARPADHASPAPPPGGNTDIGQTVLYAPGGEGSAATAGGTGSGGSGGTTTTVASTSPLVVNISWDSSVQSAPTGFTAGVLAAVQYLESQFTDAVTVNISVGYGEVHGTTLGSNALGSSVSYLSSLSYSSLAGAVRADATSTDDTSVAASLPASSPVSGTFWTTTAQAKALGLAAATGTSTDGFVGFSSSLAFDYNTADGVSAGTYDFNGVVLHELTEVMGRMLLTGATIGTTANSYTTLDLLHYASAGVRDFSASTAGYLSFDGGTTRLADFNTVSGGDAGDWAASMGYDSADAFSYSGVVNPFSTVDVRTMDAIGWNRPGVSQPTGVSVAAITSALAGAQTTTGLAANAAIAKITQIGGTVGDTYTYSLGGSGAAAFSLTTSANAATLAASSAGVAGGVNGTLYALTLGTTDTTSGNSSPTSAFDVIAGSGGADTISVAALSSAVGTATPSFVYGLAGSDSIDATGMTGHQWIAGGAGADRMTGGSGANDYLYGATADSTASTMDVITNFHAAADHIDLTGLGVTLKVAGKIATTKLAAHSVGWQTSGGNTFLYVNTSGGSENLAATNMKIEMLGTIPLGSGNILHL